MVLNFVNIERMVNMKNTLKSLSQLDNEEKAFALDYISRRPIWNAYLQKEIENAFIKMLQNIGLYKTEDTHKVHRYSSMPRPCNYGGEIPVCLEASISIRSDVEKRSLFRFLYDGPVEDIQSVFISIFGDTVTVDISCYENTQFDTSQLQNDLEMFFVGAISVMEAQLTLFSKELRSHEKIAKYVEEHHIQFDENLRPQYIF